MKPNFTTRPLRSTGLGAAVAWAMLAGPLSAQVSLTGSSYSQDFNAIGSGLPNGWGVYTGATAAALGSPATLAVATTAWSVTTGNFRNAASATGLASNASTSVQASSADRALALRQTGTFADPGGSFAVQLSNTTGLTAFNLSFHLQSLDVASTRTTTWRVDYGFGAAPTSFTAATTAPAVITTGNSTFTNQSVTVSFGSALDNQAGPVWIRIATLSTAGGSGNRATTGIDDFSLTWTAPPVPNTSVAFASTTSSANESAGSVNLALAITNPDAVNPTTVTLAATGATGRIIGYSTPVVFPAGSSANENVSVTLNDDAVCDGDENVTFTITGISGGQGTPFIGGNSTNVLTVHDNETPVNPTATTASGVDDASFTANWNAVGGATGYYLDVSTSPTFGGPGAQLAGWTFTDGNPVADSGIPANATKAISANTGGAYSYPGGANPAISTANWDGGNGSKYWLIQIETTGYSSLALSSKQQSSNTGPKNFKVQYSINGGGTWTDIPGGSVTVANDMTTGVLGNLALPAACDNQAQLSLRWIMTSNTSVNNGTVANTGTSRIDDISIDAAASPSFVPGYSNLFVNGTAQSVTGLNPSTTYYYRVRSEGGCSTGNNSNTITVTTTAGINPVLTAGTLTDFGNQCIDAASAPQHFTVDGTNLTNANVTVAALNGFAFSTSELGTYTTSLSIPQAGGTFSQDVWVIFTPAAVQSFDGNIVVGGGGAAAIIVAVTGDGINTPATTTTGVASGIGQDGATVAGTIDNAGCSSITAYGIEYSTTINFTPGSGTPMPAANLAGGSFSSILGGLSACTVYYYRAFATNAGGTAYGTEHNFETSPLGAPTANAATGILQNGFTANWSAVAGATGYQIDVSTSPSFGSNIVPGTSTTETFSGIGGAPGSYLTRNWTGVDGVEWTAYKARTDQVVFSGNDAITLQNQAGAYLQSGEVEGGVVSIHFDVVQVFSGTGGMLTVKVLSGPGFATSTTVGTISYTATASVFNATFAPIAGPVMILVQNNTSARPVIDNLAFTRAQSFIPSFLPGYNNLAVAGTSLAITGLNTSTTYYYRLRAASPNCSSANSNSIPATTLACAGNSFVVAIHTDANGGQTSWEILDENQATIATGGPYPGQNNTTITETVCIGNSPVPACYGFRLYDSFGDGLSGSGSWQLRSPDGKVLLADEFASGYITPAMPPATPGYGNSHSICLPLGPANIALNECGIFNNALGNKVYCNKVTGATQYQFEFSDPDAGFYRRITTSTNYVIFSQLNATPLTPGVKYFARVRTNVAGPVASAHFGSGCDMGLGVAQVVTCSELIQAPAYGHSCNETRTFNTNNSFIYAKPVVGGTEYQFRIFNTSEGYDQTFTRSTYILQLKWNANVAPGLTVGSTYNVEVNVKVSGVYTGFCPSSCAITIVGNTPGGRPEAMLAEAQGQVTLWPNPVRDGQVNLSIDGLADAQQKITVDILDLYGKKVFAYEFGNSGERFTTLLDLPSTVASGVYMVNITVNGKTSVQRLSIIK